MSAASPSPRPRFSGPSPIPFEAAARFTWGDEVSGKVEDRIYVSSDNIHQLVFSLPPGGAFRHSENHRTIFGADEVYCVLSGTLVLANPERGEVHRVEAGEAAFFRRDTWHHGFSFGAEPLRVLEYFSPPPSKGTSQAYARTKPHLKKSLYVQDEWLDRWPDAREEAERGQTMRVLRDSEVLWRLEGSSEALLVGILVSTEHLTVGKMRLLPGGSTGPRRHGGDLGLYLLDGALDVRTTEPTARHRLKPNDGFYVPQGAGYELVNASDRPADAIFGVSPAYR